MSPRSVGRILVCSQNANREKQIAFPPVKNLIDLRPKGPPVGSGLFAVVEINCQCLKVAVLGWIVLLGAHVRIRRSLSVAELNYG